MSSFGNTELLSSAPGHILVVVLQPWFSSQHDHITLNREDHRSRVCHHHGAFTINAHEDREDLGSSALTAWQPTLPPPGLTRVSPGINIRIATMMMMAIEKRMIVLILIVTILNMLLTAVRKLSNEPPANNTQSKFTPLRENQPGGPKQNIVHFCGEMIFNNIHHFHQNILLVLSPLCNIHHFHQNILLGLSPLCNIHYFHQNMLLGLSSCNIHHIHQ